MDKVSRQALVDKISRQATVRVNNNTIDSLGTLRPTVAQPNAVAIQEAVVDPGYEDHQSLNNSNAKDFSKALMDAFRFEKLSDKISKSEQNKVTNIQTQRDDHVNKTDSDVDTLQNKVKSNRVSAYPSSENHQLELTRGDDPLVAHMSYLRNDMVALRGQVERMSMQIEHNFETIGRELQGVTAHRRFVRRILTTFIMLMGIAIGTLAGGGLFLIYDYYRGTNSASSEVILTH